jgi:hypothetical protein
LNQKIFFVIPKSKILVPKLFEPLNESTKQMEQLITGLLLVV